MSVSVKVRDTGLRNVLKALQAKKPTIRVGILGAKAAADRLPPKKPADISFDELMRKKVNKDGEAVVREPLTNAEVGAAHEYGALLHRGNVSWDLPQRSFLRMPLNDHLTEYLERTGAFKKKVMEGLLVSGDLMPFFRKIAATAETVVHDAFETGGFGQWPASNMKGKKNHETLVETTQLRKSITSEVK